MPAPPPGRTIARRVLVLAAPLVLGLVVLLARGRVGRAQPTSPLPASAAAASRGPSAAGAAAAAQAAAVADDTHPAPRSVPPGPLPTPRPVYVGVYAFQLPQFDIAQSIYLVDFWVWFRWQGDDIDPTQTFELLNLYEGWDVLKQAIYVDAGGAPRPDDLGDGWRYQVYRIHGRFARTFDVRAYPFDDQQLTIAFEDNNATIDDQIYVADDGTTAVDPGLSVDGWRIDHISAEVGERAYPTNWGDPRRPPGADRYAQFRYTIHITRPVLAHLVTTIVPIGIVMLIALAAFLIDPKYFAERVGLATTCLISAVALQLTAQGELPTTSYLVLLDHVYNLAYLTIFLSLVQSVVAVRLIDGDARPRALRLDRLGLAVAVALFFGGTALLIALRA